MSAALDAGACWLCTFAVHGTLFALVALAASALLRQRALAWQEVLLRLALVGGLLTSALQTAAGGGPLWSWPATVAVETAVVPSVRAPALRSERAPTTAPAAAAVVPMRERALAGLAELGDRLHAAVPPAAVLLATAGACALLGLSWLLRARTRLHALLRSRVPEQDPRVLAIAGRAADECGLPRVPAVHRSEWLGSPVTFGVRRAEVCLPARIDELGDDELRALFCHEFAHIRRGDAMWLWSCAWLQAMFPWQLLLWPLRRRLCALAELRCDAEAGRRSSPEAVAQCLVQVATWLGGRRQPPLGVLAMAARPSALRVRVEAALAARPEHRVSPAACTVCAVLALGLFTAAAPGARRERADRSVVAEPRHAAAAPAAQPPLQPAPAIADSPAAPQLLALRAEQAALLREVAQLRRDVAGNDDPELRRLLDLLQIRSAAMARLGAQLEAALTRIDNEGSTGSRRTR